MMLLLILATVELSTRFAIKPWRSTGLLDRSSAFDPRPGMAMGDCMFASCIRKGGPTYCHYPSYRDLQRPPSKSNTL
jgi:hypothetical protein